MTPKLYSTGRAVLFSPDGERCSRLPWTVLSDMAYGKLYPEYAGHVMRAGEVFFRLQNRKLTQPYGARWFLLRFDATGSHGAHAQEMEERSEARALAIHQKEDAVVAAIDARHAEDLWSPSDAQRSKALGVLGMGRDVVQVRRFQGIRPGEFRRFQGIRPSEFYPDANGRGPFYVDVILRWKTARGVDRADPFDCVVTDFTIKDVNEACSGFMALPAAELIDEAIQGNRITFSYRQWGEIAHFEAVLREEAAVPAPELRAA